MRVRVLGMVALVGAMLAYGLDSSTAAASSDPVPDADGVALYPAAHPSPTREEIVFAVAKAGRYSIRARSHAGASLQIVDRMAGPSAPVGTPGGQDGRTDLFLDRGTYKAIIASTEADNGTVALEVKAFHEQSGANPPQLLELRPIDATLGDFEQRSWWLDVSSRQTVSIEAAGRYLADLRIWKDGSWLVDAAPSAAEFNPAPGQPLAVKDLTATLEPGLYLVTAYGGLGKTWTTGSDAAPLHVRFGIPELPEVSGQRMVASPFGVDRYLVPRKTNYFRLQLDEQDTATLAVGPYDARDPFRGGNNAVAIEKNNRDRTVELMTSSLGDEYSVVTVTREAGKPYTLQNFYAASVYTFSNSGDYWIEPIRVPLTEDSADVTSVLTAVDMGRETIVSSSAIEVGAGQGWSRRFNLLEPVTLFVKVNAPGRYIPNATGDNVEEEFRFEPVGPRPSNYRVPRFELANHVWDLDAGIYQLTIQPRPEKKGIATVTVKPADFAGAVASAPRLEVQPLVTHLNVGQYRLYLNRVPGISSGLVLRSLPIDLAAGLPMTLGPNASAEVPVSVPAGGDGTLSLTDDAGKDVALALDGNPPTARPRVKPGDHHVAIVNDAGRDRFLQLQFDPDRPSGNAEPLPPLSPERLAALPNFPTLSASAPIYFDTAREEQHTFNIAVADPALYRLETTGLLSTGGNLRTRIVTSLRRADANGIGRNLLIQTYLREGDYQLSTTPTGRSAGHLGLGLTATPIEDHGLLMFSIPSRATLLPAHGIRYEFQIDHPGRYRLKAIGMNRVFDVRIEDADGWPVMEPVTKGELERDFLPGAYHMIILPADIEARSLALIEEVKPPEEITGHGPHPLALDKQVSFEWLEPEADAERIPDHWQFDLTAAADIDVALGEGVVGTLVRAGKDHDAPIASFFRAPGWKGRLDAGTYRIDVASIRPNNHLPYTIEVKSRQLLAGYSRAITAPADIPIAIGGDDLVELDSFGGANVRGSLYDSHNHLIAENDDRPNDWNFDIAATLTPGDYRLHVDPVGTKSAETRIDLVRSTEKTEAALAVPGMAKVSDAAVHTIPLNPPSASGLLLVEAASKDSVSMSLESMAAGGGWQTLDVALGQSPVVALPVAATRQKSYRVRVWSTDHKTTDIVVIARLVEAHPVDEQSFAAGVTPQNVEGTVPPVAVVAVAARESGIFQLTGAAASTRWTGKIGVPVATDPGGVALVGETPLWLVAQNLAPGEKLRGSRIDFVSEITLALPPGVTDVALPSRAADAGPELWLAQSRFGQPGIVPGALGHAAGATGVGMQSAITVVTGPAAKTTLHLWNAEGRDAALRITLRRVAVSAPAPEHAAADQTDLVLAPGSARLVTFAKAEQRLRLALPPNVAAVATRQGETVATLWSDQDSRDFAVDADADAVLLINVGAVEARASVVTAAFAAGNHAAVVTGAQRFNLYDGSRGVVRVHVSVKADERTDLHVAGVDAHATFIGIDGIEQRGNDLSINRSGTLLIDHAPGFVSAWLDGATRGAKPINLPLDHGTQMVKLAGPSARFAVAPATPLMLAVRTTEPVIAVFTGPDGKPVTQAYPQGGLFSRYLPVGRTEIALLPTAGGNLAGDAVMIPSGIVPIDEGLGEAVRIGGGETRYYAFTLAAPTTVGIGARASVDLAECRLLDSAGKEIGTGLVQMHKLEKGTYVLAVTIPPDVEPIEIKPALVGARSPDTGPPDEVKRHYLQLVGRLPAN